MDVPSEPVDCVSYEYCNGYQLHIVLSSRKESNHVLDSSIDLSYLKSIYGWSFHLLWFIMGLITAFS